MKIIDSQIVYSGKVKKINRFLVSQERILVVTPKKIYNIKNKSNLTSLLSLLILQNLDVQREISLEHLTGITKSTSRAEW